MTDNPFDASDIVPPSPDEDPEARKWVHVLTHPVTIHRDMMMILDAGELEFIPVFQDRGAAEAFLSRLGPPAADEYDIQAMHIIDVRKFAGEKGLKVMTLDGQGAVLDSWLFESGTA